MLGRRLKNAGLISENDGRGALTDAHRRLFERLCEELPSQRRFCAITSAGRQEGRSTLAVNLAITAARESGGPVLLIDADTESPSLHNPFGLTPGPGLSEVLSGDGSAGDQIRPTGIEGLQILTSGDRPPGAIALAESPKIDAFLSHVRSRFGWILADTAALMAAPAVALFLRRADAVVLAVRSGSTRVQLLNQAVAQLDHCGANTLGIVLTQRRFVIPAYVYRRL